MNGILHKETWCSDHKRGKLSCTGGIVLRNGETIKEVEKDGYRHLGILELDK